MSIANEVTAAPRAHGLRRYRPHGGPGGRLWRRVTRPVNGRHGRTRMMRRLVILGAGGDLNINGPGDFLTLERADLTYELAVEELPPYARLLLDILRGDNALAIRDDEAEESWRIVEPILAAWQAGLVPLAEYPAGSYGPSTLGGARAAEGQ